MVGSKHSGVWGSWLQSSGQHSLLWTLLVYTSLCPALTFYLLQFARAASLLDICHLEKKNKKNKIEYRPLFVHREKRSLWRMQRRAGSVSFAPSLSLVGGRQQIALPLAPGPVLDWTRQNRVIYSQDAAAMWHDVGTLITAGTPLYRDRAIGQDRQQHGRQRGKEAMLEIQSMKRAQKEEEEEKVWMQRRWEGREWRCWWEDREREGQIQ